MPLRLYIQAGPHSILPLPTHPPVTLRGIQHRPHQIRLHSAHQPPNPRVSSHRPLQLALRVRPRIRHVRHRIHACRLRCRQTRERRLVASRLLFMIDRRKCVFDVGRALRSLLCNATRGVEQFEQRVGSRRPGPTKTRIQSAKTLSMPRLDLQTTYHAVEVGATSIASH